MKVLGVGDRDTYICEVSKTEIEKFMNLYYNKMERLKINDEVDLGKGYDFEDLTRRNLKQMQEFIERHREVIKLITEGIGIMGRTQADDPEYIHWSHLPITALETLADRYANADSQEHLQINRIACNILELVERRREEAAGS